jgi:hypothetical protein
MAGPALKPDASPRANKKGRRRILEERACLPGA